MRFSQKVLTAYDILFLLHIPKTGGSAVFEAAKKNYLPSEILDLSDDEYLNAFDSSYSSDQFSLIKLVRQHQDYSFKSFFPREPFTFTMIREPLTRTLSYFKHVRRVKSHNLHRIVNEQNLSLSDFIKIAPSIEVRNTQMRYLCGFDIANDENFSDIEKLEVAKLHLRNLTCFGITEEFARSMKVLQWVFLWEERDWHIVNRSPEQTSVETLSASDRQILTELNTLDIELYNYAHALFNHQVMELIDQGVDL